MTIPERDIRRLHHLAFCELGACDAEAAREVAERYASGDFEITPADRARAPQTCRWLERIREEAESAIEVEAGGTCRECGCTDAFACCDEFFEPCHWVEPDLCSACAPEAADG